MAESSRTQDNLRSLPHVAQPQSVSRNKAAFSRVPYAGISPPAPRRAPETFATWFVHPAELRHLPRRSIPPAVYSCRTLLPRFQCCVSLSFHPRLPDSSPTSGPRRYLPPRKRSSPVGFVVPEAPAKGLVWTTSVPLSYWLGALAYWTRRPRLQGAMRRPPRRLLLAPVPAALGSRLKRVSLWRSTTRDLPRGKLSGKSRRSSLQSRRLEKRLPQDPRGSRQQEL